MITKIGKYFAKKVKHLDAIDKLGLKPDEYIIGASGCCVLHGMPIENNDLDIHITRKAFDRIKDKLTLVNDDAHTNTYNDPTGHLDITVDKPNHWYTWDKYAPMSEVVGGHRYHTPEGNKKYYEELYGISGKEKHKKRLDWITENCK